eukprot:366301-Chlamydomonas_euryale.AAC.47
MNAVRGSPVAAEVGAISAVVAGPVEAAAVAPVVLHVAAASSWEPTHPAAWEALTSTDSPQHAAGPGAEVAAGAGVHRCEIDAAARKARHVMKRIEQRHGQRVQGLAVQ